MDLFPKFCALRAPPAPDAHLHLRRTAGAVQVGAVQVGAGVRGVIRLPTR